MPPSYIWVHAVVLAYGRGQTDRQTDIQTLVTTIHFASSTTHTKCNNGSQWLLHVDRGQHSDGVRLLIAVVAFCLKQSSMTWWTETSWTRTMNFSCSLTSQLLLCALWSSSIYQIATSQLVMSGAPFLFLLSPFSLYFFLRILTSFHFSPPFSPHSPSFYSFDFSLSFPHFFIHLFRIIPSLAVPFCSRKLSLEVAPTNHLNNI